MKLIEIIMAHAIGDYLFQSDYLAANKGKDWYILFIHCILYIVPFAFFFGLDWRILLLAGTHFVIDALKARYEKIDIWADQILHYVIGILLYIW